MNRVKITLDEWKKKLMTECEMRATDAVYC